MNQAILKIIDDKIYWMYKVVTEDWPQDEYYSEWQQALLDLKNEISSLPSDTQWIDTLQRLSFFWEFMAEDKDWRYIRYDDLVELLNR